MAATLEEALSQHQLVDRAHCSQVHHAQCLIHSQVVQLHLTAEVQLPRLQAHTWAHQAQDSQQGPERYHSSP